MSIAELATALVAVIGSILGILRFLHERDRKSVIREAFASVVKSLAGDNEVERAAAAILLRRFFDPKTEVGLRGTPFAREVVDVITAMLRSVPSGDLQKLLADGLRYAPTLKRADLQRTNLQNAYLGPRVDPGNESRQPVDVSFADFYGADLSGASLKEARAVGAQFYQARLRDTVFRKADLRQANFFQADLGGAGFDGALLHGASFAEARNVPAYVLDALDERKKCIAEEPLAEPPTARPRRIHVFVSRPGVLDPAHRPLFTALLRDLEEQEDLVPEMVERNAYPKFGIFAEVQRVMAGCAGVLVFGQRELEVERGSWRSGTVDARPVTHVGYATPWLQIEAGMAIMADLPVLVAGGPGIEGGIFDISGSEHRFYRLPGDEKELSAVFAEWSGAVKERARAMRES